MKQLTNKYGVDDSLKFGLSTMYDCTFVIITMRHCRLSASHHDNKLQNTEIFTMLLIRQNDRCPEIAFSGHQHAENEHNETLNK